MDQPSFLISALAFRSNYHQPPNFLFGWFPFSRTVHVLERPLFSLNASVNKITNVQSSRSLDSFSSRIRSDLSNGRRKGGMRRNYFHFRQPNCRAAKVEPKVKTLCKWTISCKCTHVRVHSFGIRLPLTNYSIEWRCKWSREEENRLIKSILIISF